MIIKQELSKFFSLGAHQVCLFNNLTYKGENLRVREKGKVPCRAVMRRFITFHWLIQPMSVTLCCLFTMKTVIIDVNINYVFTQSLSIT